MLIGDTELGSLKDNQLTKLRRDKIGFIFQAFNLLPTLTALQNITLPMDITGCPDGGVHPTSQLATTSKPGPSGPGQVDFQVRARSGIPDAPDSGVLTARAWFTPMRLRSKARTEATM